MKTTREEIQDTLQRGMTVADLINQLRHMDPQAYVLFACNYGDYHRTQQALPVEDISLVDSAQLYGSAYSHSGMALIDDPDDGVYWCEQCEEESAVPTCIKCGSRCVDEEGKTIDEADEDESLPVVILKGMGR